MPPLKLASTADSKKSVGLGLVAFGRWAKKQNRSIPPALRDGLREHILKPDLLGLHLGDTFHLILQTEKDSSDTISIFEFDASIADVMLVRCIKSSYQDRYHLNMLTGALHSRIGWLQGSHDYHSTIEIPPNATTAPSLLLENWICPRRWLQEDDRLVVVRPSDLPPPVQGEDSATTRTTTTRATNGVALCDCAISHLKKGFTLLLVKGNLIGIDLPWDRRPMLIAGLMFKEGEPQHQEPIEEGTVEVSNQRYWGRGRLDGLSFILAERAQRRTGFTGNKDAEEANADKPGHQFVEDMYEWHEHDVYKYVPGRWR